MTPTRVTHLVRIEEHPLDALLTPEATERLVRCAVEVGAMNAACQFVATDAGAEPHSALAVVTERVTAFAKCARENMVDARAVLMVLRTALEPLASATPYARRLFDVGTRAFYGTCSGQG